MSFFRCRETLYVNAPAGSPIFCKAFCFVPLKSNIRIS